MRKIAGFLASILFLMPAVATSQGNSGKTPVVSILETVADIPMPGPAVRFDYQSLDTQSGMLYISHMNAGQLVVFDTVKRTVVGNLNGFEGIHGVLAVPELSRVYASVGGEHAIKVVDCKTLQTLAQAGPVLSPDGLAYAPRAQRVFVSDERGNSDAVLDTATNTLVARIALPGNAGNTVYDPVSGHILVVVHGANELAVIDPASDRIISQYPLAGIENPHGMALDTFRHLAFVAGEENHSLAVVDLDAMKVLSTYQTGDTPDVLAFDPGLRRLYVSSESGTVSVFQESGRELKLLGEFYMPHAHTVSVDPKTHLVYFPLQNVDGHPLLRIMKPSDLH